MASNNHEHSQDEIEPPVRLRLTRASSASTDRSFTRGAGVDRSRFDGAAANPRQARLAFIIYLFNDSDERKNGLITPLYNRYIAQEANVCTVVSWAGTAGQEMYANTLLHNSSSSSGIRNACRSIFGIQEF